MSKEKQMTICMPIENDQSLSSLVCPHFGSAPMFAFIDPGTLSVCIKQNSNNHQAHGGCNPLSVMAGENVTVVIVKGIGAGAIQKLSAAGITVVATPYATVEDSVRAFVEGRLSPLLPQDACGHHGHHHGGETGHGCR
jgi:predicted Fe-Mo cluster-binding NifX family protein